MVHTRLTGRAVLLHVMGDATRTSMAVMRNAQGSAIRPDAQRTVLRNRPSVRRNASRTMEARRVRPDVEGLTQPVSKAVNGTWQLRPTSMRTGASQRSSIEPNFDVAANANRESLATQHERTMNSTERRCLIGDVRHRADRVLFVGADVGPSTKNKFSRRSARAFQRGNRSRFPGSPRRFG